MTAVRASLPEEVQLPRPPGMIRRFMADHPLIIDVSIVVCYVLGSLLMAIVTGLSAQPGPDYWDDSGVGLPPEGLGPFDLPLGVLVPAGILAVLRTGLVATALLLRRRYPLTGLIVVTVVLIGDMTPMAFANLVALWFMLYAVPVYRGVRAGWLGYAIALVGSLVAQVLEVNGIAITRVFQAPQPGEVVLADEIIVALLSAIWLLVVLMIGINLGNRRRYVAAIIDRAHQLARERDQLAQLAVAEERSRIAREMHDIVAHSVSVMIALSEGAAEASRLAPEAASEAMRKSAETGRTALTEMRRLLGVLADPGDVTERVPQPSVDELPRLVASFRDAGLEATLDAPGDARGGQAHELAIYRIVQEGLTNVLRYAGPGARVVVRVTGGEARTEVEIRDFGPTTNRPSPAAGVGSGRGLAGLAERVRMFGGEIDAGPTPDGGWRVRAVLPVNAAPRSPDEGGGE